MDKRGYRILLVEDAEPDVLLVREALERSGLTFELEVLDDGEKAVEFIDSMAADRTVNPPDVMLLDLNLPKWSGGDILARVRKSPVCGGVPVVILTSSDSPRDKSQAAELQATHYFRKPSRLDEFMKLGPLIRDLLTSRARPLETQV